MKNSEVASEWASGRAAVGSNMYTDGITIWSYGTHFPMATKTTDGKIVMNLNKYSSTTSKHQSYVRRHCEPDLFMPTEKLRELIERYGRDLNKQLLDKV